ncbi:PEP-CTERM sorting domain-containing protein [Colwellia sp. BRX10-3]|uniref:PEP-CTERM sorting domain-containing protein n=1 Tax=Colwellia sp. BRX10-3 TaxID=2759844 RepID=UPI0015F42633|nr:PEP-CTERM sorting domain-containing protein [Colwellia sp. BRX10-3]MBA6389219.1 PEP-CTERM sorting domain-containing protein [Colwellia sp. BRX10-3]
MNKILAGLTVILLLTPSLALAISFEGPEPTQVPEPTSLALFGLAIAGIIASRLRKK